MSWRLQILGETLLARGDDPAFRPERKTAAALAYLALEGATSRSRMAGLLWPDSVEEVARNNLAQTLHRVRRRAGQDLVTGSDPLRLNPEVRVDAAELKVRAFRGEHEAVAATEGALLDGAELDDCPELSDWVLAEREVILGLRRAALAALLARAEGDGRLSDAIAHAERLLDLDPVAEGTHRTIMRLHYRAGDRPAALRAYHRCRAVLEREFAVEPLPETKELARSIDRGTLPSDPARPVAPTLPDVVRRPPVLIGRRRAWEQMEAAWAQGRTIYLTGEPGSGKTRLAQDFANAKGRALYLPAQPGHQDVPYAAAASLARTRLAAAPEVRLPDWVRRELSRILPELRDGDEPPPIEREEGRLRFFQAYAEMVRLTGVGWSASISDDTQYYDRATVELGAFLLSQAVTGERRGTPPYIVIYRSGELPEASRGPVDRLVASGLAVRIELEPLDADATADLLRSLNLGELAQVDASRLAHALHRRTGGNTLFLLETLRSLLETKRLEGATSDSLPLSAKVEAVVRGRLARLSPAAQRVVQAAAVLQSEFDLDVVARVLEVDPFELLAVWEELERAQIFRGDGFAHDLLYEAARDAIARPVRELLHRRSAAVLVDRGASPSRIARHLLAAGEETRAVPFLRAAAERALDRALVEEARRFLDSADGILQRQGNDGALADLEVVRRRLEAAAKPA